MTIVYHLGCIYNLNSEIASAELTEGSGWSCYKSHMPSVFSALNKRILKYRIFGGLSGRFWYSWTVAP